MTTAREALQRLRDHRTEVAEVCRRHEVILITAFGSALDPRRQPRDLDLGVLFDYDQPRDLLGVLDDLAQIAAYNDLDVTVLNDAGPVIRERALVGAEVLFEGARRPPPTLRRVASGSGSERR